jgi:hypothetical protein
MRINQIIKEFAMDDDEDPTDNYPCYDCGSTIFLHHTKLCELAEPNAIRDLPEKPGSQHWTGEIPRGLYPIPGLAEGVAEEEDKIDSRFKKTEWMPLLDAIKILKYYGATPEKYMGHDMFPYYDIEGNRKYLEDITWNADNSKNVKVSLVNAAVRELKAQKQGLAEKLGDNRPKLGSKRDAGKSVRKWRSARSLDETGVEEGDKKPEQPEADYGDDYQAMVSRVKKLAGLGPLKTVYDPNKRVYKNVPVAQQPSDKK